MAGYGAGKNQRAADRKGSAMSNACTFEEGGLALAMERARHRWNQTDSDADYQRYLEAENRWLKSLVPAAARMTARTGEVV